MSGLASQIVFWALAGVCVIGGLVVVLTKEVMRLILGLGAFLIGLAGLFMYHSAPFVAMAVIFLYVGGVLVLMLFALMMLKAGKGGRLELASRMDLAAASVAIGLPALMVGMLRGLPAPAPPLEGSVSGQQLSRALLGQYLPQFEMLGLFLLLALVAALTVIGTRASTKVSVGSRKSTTEEVAAASEATLEAEGEVSA